MDFATHRYGCLRRTYEDIRITAQLKVGFAWQDVSEPDKHKLVGSNESAGPYAFPVGQRTHAYGCSTKVAWKAHGGVVPHGDPALLGLSHFDSGLILTGGDHLAGDCHEGILSYPHTFRFRRGTAKRYVVLASWIKATC